MTTPPPHRVLVVEDDPELGALLAARLTHEGYAVERATTGPSAVAAVATFGPDLILLDVGLPGFDGVEVCRRVRGSFAGLIVFLTARDDELDQVLGLELGGDDYVLKPVTARVLVARIRALLRREDRAAAGAALLRVGPFVVDPMRREVRAGARAVPVTTAEFDLLAFLASRAGQVVSRDALYEEVLGIPFDGLDRTIDVQISRLRHKLSAATDGGADVVRTVRGAGYLAVGP